MLTIITLCLQLSALTHMSFPYLDCMHALQLQGGNDQILHTSRVPEMHSPPSQDVGQIQSQAICISPGTNYLKVASHVN